LYVLELQVVIIYYPKNSQQDRTSRTAVLTWQSSWSKI